MITGNSGNPICRNSMHAFLAEHVGGSLWTETSAQAGDAALSDAPLQEARKCFIPTLCQLSSNQKLKHLAWKMANLCLFNQRKLKGSLCRVCSEVCFEESNGDGSGKNYCVFTLCLPVSSWNSIFLMRSLCSRSILFSQRGLIDSNRCASEKTNSLKV